MKILFLFLIFFILVRMLNALEIGIAPSEINFLANSNQVICHEIILNSDRELFLIGDILWTENEKNSRKIEKYNNSSEELEIEAKFPRTIKINKKETIEACLKFKNTGKYYGALIYAPEEGYAGIGAWIFADVKNKPENLKNNAKINKKTFSKIFLILSAALLIIFLLILKIKERSPIRLTSISFLSSQ